MADFAELARRLVHDLGLTLPPVAICLADEVPLGVRAYSGAAPAGCVFWQEAMQGAFATSASDHELCAIGVHTHNLPAAAGVRTSELAQVLKIMTDLKYVTEDEVARIPVFRSQVRHIVYAPLAETPLKPDVVLLFAHSRQGLVISEASQRLQGAAPPALGRPACAVVPHALNSGRAALSLGCCGARAYLDILSDDIALWAIPGARLELYVEQISVLARANVTLARFHTHRHDDVRAGRRPTVQESLARCHAAPAAAIAPTK